MCEFQGKIAIVTGGGAGIGKSICEEMAERGATVIIPGIRFVLRRPALRRMLSQNFSPIRLTC
jgi:Dehydrogenases with different specificities (related to short-chain alcohol dehydrogenases)